MNNAEARLFLTNNEHPKRKRREGKTLDALPHIPVQAVRLALEASPSLYQSVSGSEASHESEAPLLYLHCRRSLLSKSCFWLSKFLLPVLRLYQW